MAIQTRKVAAQKEKKTNNRKLPPVAVARFVERMRYALDAFRKKLAPPATVMLEMSTTFYISQALYLAARLQIADHLQAGPRHVTDLAQMTGTDARLLHRVLRALASVGVFKEVGSRCFQLTPLATTLQTNQSGSMREWVLLLGSPWHWRLWGALDSSVQTGQPASEHLFGFPFFEYLKQHPEEGQVFDRAMTNISDLSAVPVRAAYDFRGVNSLIDVGGGSGFLLASTLRAYPKMHGILFDAPQVITASQGMLEAQGVAERCTTVGGDFFEEVPPGGDVYLLKNIIHDWGDDDAIAILKNCHRAMTEQGKLLLVEMVIPPGNAPSFGKLLDLEILVITSGGYERTETEFRALLEAAGFRLTRIVPTVSPLYVIEARRI